MSKHRTISTVPLCKLCCSSNLADFADLGSKRRTASTMLLCKLRCSSSNKLCPCIGTGRPLVYIYIYIYIYKFYLSFLSVFSFYLSYRLVVQIISIYCLHLLLKRASRDHRRRTLGSDSYESAFGFLPADASDHRG